MQYRWRDISIPLQPGVTVWPGDPEFTFEPDSRIAQGASCNTSKITMSTHTGTHCDAPWHFIDGGKTLDQVDPGVFIGEAQVIEIPEVDRIHASDLPDEPLPDRVLFKTRNSDIPIHGKFETSFVALSVDAAERLVKDRVLLVGIDYLSIAPYGNGAPVHRILLSAGIFVVEGLRLAGIRPGKFNFMALPLPVAGADGAPCRAFIFA